MDYCQCNCVYHKDFSTVLYTQSFASAEGECMSLIHRPLFKGRHVHVL